MLEYLRSQRLIRKFRLFAAACCRTNTKLILKVGHGYRAIAVVEALADGLPVPDDLSALRDRLERESYNFMRIDVSNPPKEDYVIYHAGGAVYHALQDEQLFSNVPILLGRQHHADDLLAAAFYVACAAAHWERKTTRDQVNERIYQRVLTGLVPLAHDILGNPFHPPRLLDEAWLKWNDAIVVKIAAAIYEDRGFDQLPILADALEEAGCCDPEILTHLRSPGPHALGCWAPDRLLQKK
jgi:hypothetical protein